MMNIKMKKTMRKYILFIAFITIGTYTFAQNPVHYVGLWGNLGYSSMFMNPADFDVKTQGGFGYGLGWGYELGYNKFLFDAGFEYDALNSLYKSSFTVDAMMTQPYQMGYHYNFTTYKERLSVGYLQVPIMVGLKFNRYFAKIGTKLGLNLYGNYNTNFIFTTVGDDPELVEELQNMGNHFFVTDREMSSGKTALSLKPNVTISAEFGVDLDEWLAAKPRSSRKGERQKKTFKESLHYRTSLFVDYGLLNINGQEGNLICPFEENKMDPINIKPSSLLNTRGGMASGTHPFLVGVKFAVMYEFPQPKPKKPVVKPTPKPTPPPTPKPQPEPKVELLLCGVVNDLDTQEPLSAQVYIWNQDATANLYSGDADMAGEFCSDLKAGTYKAMIYMQGYMPYEQEFSFVKDTVTFALQKIKVGRRIILHNLFFATNKTDILPESEDGLEDLYLFLSENPDVRIKIIGHTDNVGSDADNKKLSEGRARSVVEVMKSLGIASDRLEWEGRGESDPIATNDTEEGRAENRRVEFVILSMQ